MNKFKKYLKENYKRILLIILIIVGYIGLLFACKYANKEIKDNVPNIQRPLKRNAQLPNNRLTNSISIDNASIYSWSSQYSDNTKNLTLVYASDNELTFSFDFVRSMALDSYSINIYFDLDIFNSIVDRYGFFLVYYDTSLSSSYSFYQLTILNNNDLYGSTLDGTVYSVGNGNGGDFTIFNNYAFNRIRYNLNFMFNTYNHPLDGTYNVTLYFNFYDFTSNKNEIYNDGVDYGENVGYNDGYEIGFEEGYLSGWEDAVYEDIESGAYDKGFNAGYINGKNDGYNLGFNDGKQYVLDNLSEYDLYTKQQYLNYGENQKNIGISIGSTKQCSVNSLFFAIADIPTTILSSLLSFELFGINMFLAFGSIATLLLIIWVIRKVK